MFLEERACQGERTAKNEWFIRNRLYWLLCGLVLIITYGFLLTNQSIGVDDENFRFYFDNYGIASSGRYGYIILMKLLNTYAYLPFWRDAIALLILLVGVNIWICFFQHLTEKKFSNLSCIIFSCIALTYPLLGRMYVYISINIEVSLVLLLGGAAAYCTFLFLHTKQKRYLIYTAAMLVLGLSLIENCLNYYISGIFMGLLIANLYPNATNQHIGKSGKDRLLYALKVVGISVGIMVFCMIVNAVFCKVMQHLLGLEGDTYTDKFLRWNFHDLLGSINALLLDLKRNFIKYYHEYFYFKMYLLAICLLLILGVVMSIRKKNWLIFLLAVGEIATTFVFYLITGNANMVTRTFVVYAVFVAFVIALCYELMPKKALKITALILSFLIVFYQSKEINEFLNQDYGRYVKDKNLAGEIHREIERVYGGVPGLPVVFIGQPLGYVEYPNTEDDVNMRTIFENVDSDSLRIHRFFDMLGYHYENPLKEEITIANAEEIETNEITQRAMITAQDMPVWPQEGSVTVTEESIIVKLGPVHCRSYEGTLEDLMQEEGIEEDGTVKGGLDVARTDTGAIYIKGWGCFENRAPAGTRICVVLSGETNSYVLSTEQTPVTDPARMSSEYKNSENLNGFWVYGDYPQIENGVYEVNLLLSSGNQQSILTNLQQIVVDFH